MVTKNKEEGSKAYSSEKITVLEGLEAVREKFDIIGISQKVRKKGDILELSSKLKIKPRILNLAVEEARILKFFPDLLRSKVNALSRLKTDRELLKFAEIYGIRNIKARELYGLVKKWNENIQKNPLIFLTEEEQDFIIGSLLGDASIRKRDKYCCFRVAHSLKQEKYIRWKLDLLKFFKISEFVKRSRLINGRQVNMFYLSTRTHPIFNYYRNLFYKNNKKVINNKLISLLNPRSLAFWICDDGSYNIKQKYIILCTNAFTLKEHKLLKGFFKKKFNLNPTIGFRDKRYYYLRFKKNDSEKLAQIVKPFIHNSMFYKIGEDNG